MRFELLGPQARIGFVFILSSPGSTPKSAEIALFLCVFVMFACSLKLASLVNFTPVPGPDFPQSAVAAAAAMVPVASSKVSASVRPVRPVAEFQTPTNWLEPGGKRTTLDCGLNRQIERLRRGG